MLRKVNENTENSDIEEFSSDDFRPSQVVISKFDSPKESFSISDFHLSKGVQRYGNFYSMGFLQRQKKYMQIKKEKIFKQQQEKEIKLMQKMKDPKINRKYNVERDKGLKIQDRYQKLLEKKRLKLEKRKQLFEQLKEEKELESVTFKPKINKPKHKYPRNIKQYLEDQKAWEQTRRNKILALQKKKKTNFKLLFQPKMNENSQKINRQKLNKGSFQERQENYEKIREEKRRMLKHQSKPTFRPVLYSSRSSYKSIYTDKSSPMKKKKKTFAPRRKTAKGFKSKSSQKDQKKIQQVKKKNLELDISNVSENYIDRILDLFSFEEEKLEPQNAPMSPKSKATQKYEITKEMQAQMQKNIESLYNSAQVMNMEKDSLRKVKDVSKQEKDVLKQEKPRVLSVKKVKAEKLSKPERIDYNKKKKVKKIYKWPKQKQSEDNNKAMRKQDLQHQKESYMEQLKSKEKVEQQTSQINKRSEQQEDHLIQQQIHQSLPIMETLQQPKKKKRKKKFSAAKQRRQKRLFTSGEKRGYQSFQSLLVTKDFLQTQSMTKVTFHTKRRRREKKNPQECGFTPKRVILRS